MISTRFHQTRKSCHSSASSSAESFINPVVTKCKHYFCEKCALQHYKKSQRCYACGAQTNGVFNPAKEIITRMEKQKQAANIENKDDDDDDDDD